MDPFKALNFCPNCGKSNWSNQTERLRICKDCGYEFYKNPTIGSCGFVFDDKGRLLVVRRAKNPAKGTLAIPGGFCEAGETVEDAVCREVFEETGIKVAVEEFLFDLPDDYEYKGVELYPLDFYFKCKIIDMSLAKLDESESSEMLFIAPDEINPEEFGLPANRNAVKRYFAK